jgi:hypothetical protein
VYLPSLQRSFLSLSKKYNRSLFDGHTALVEEDGILLTMPQFLLSLRSICGVGDEVLLMEYLLVINAISVFSLSTNASQIDKWDYECLGVKVPHQLTVGSAPAVTNTERGALHIYKTLQNLHHQQQRLETEVEKTKARITTLLQTQHKPQALAELKKKKKMEKLILEKSEIIHKMNEILYQIESAKANQMIFDAYSAGVAVLSHYRKDLDVSRVVNVMDELEELVANQAEVEEAMARPVVGENYNEEEIEEELLLLTQQPPLSVLSDESGSTILGVSDNSRVVEGEKFRNCESLHSLPQPPSGVDVRKPSNRVEVGNFV